MRDRNQQRPDGASVRVSERATDTRALRGRRPAWVGPDAFGFRDIVRDQPTLFKFTAVLGLQMGQVFPSAFFGLILTAIYRENGLPLDMFWVFAVPAVPGWLRPL